jgi:hypothetical protein
MEELNTQCASNGNGDTGQEAELQRSTEQRLGNVPVKSEEDTCLNIA